MTEILHLYPNCSLGGMTTVYRNRALSDPTNSYTFIFSNDRSGAVAYQSLPNVTIRIARPDRYKAFVQYAVTKCDYDVIRVTSLPKMVPLLRGSNSEIIYEFHSSAEKVIEQELAELDRSLVSKIVAPSEFLADAVRARLPASERGMVEVLPNLVDHGIFTSEGVTPDLNLGDGAIPLIWIGRLDKGKNVSDFLRILRLMPDSYIGVLILSYEDTPGRMADMLGLAAAMGVDDRIRILLNRSQSQIAEIYRYASTSGGVFCSTSLGESFGYGVAEALAAGLNSIAYEVGALSELSGGDIAHYDMVPVGDLHAFASSILSKAPRSASH